jgi:hypothetical protein
MQTRSSSRPLSSLLCAPSWSRIGPQVTSSNRDAVALPFQLLAISNSDEPKSQFSSAALTYDVAKTFAAKDAYGHAFRLNPKSNILGIDDCDASVLSAPAPTSRTSCSSPTTAHRGSTTMTRSAETITTQIGRRTPRRTAEFTERAGRRPAMKEVATVIDTEQRIAALASIMTCLDLDAATGPTCPSSLRATDETTLLDSLLVERIAAELALAAQAAPPMPAAPGTPHPGHGRPAEAAARAEALADPPMAYRTVTQPLLGAAPLLFPLARRRHPASPQLGPSARQPQAPRGFAPPLAPLPHPLAQRFERSRTVPVRASAMTGLPRCELHQLIGLVLAVAAATFAVRLLFVSAPAAPRREPPALLPPRPCPDAAASPARPPPPAPTARRTLAM